MTQGEVLYIDDRGDALNSYALELEEIFGAEVVITKTSPCPTLQAMLDYILSMVNLVSIVVDERLSDSGGANYKGIELSKAVRGRFPKLPIYILTNYPNDIVEGGFNVEFVVEKGDLANKNFKIQLSARVRRHIDVYNDILSSREQRYAYLLPKFLESTLSETERTEFYQLEAIRIKPFSHEFIENEELKKRFEEQEALILKVRSELGGKI